MFVQGRPALDRVRHYLTICIGEPVPVGAWVMSRTSHAPVHRDGQPAFPWLTLGDRSPEKVRGVFLETYQSVEALLGAIIADSPLDLAVRFYGESLVAADYRASLVSLWKALEVLGRGSGPPGIPGNKGQRTFAFLSGLGLAPDKKTFQDWRRLRNRIAHGSLGDQEERVVHEANHALLELSQNVILSQVLVETGIQVEPVLQRMLHKR